MTETAVRTDVHKALDVHLHLAPHSAFSFVFGLDDRADLRDLVVVQFADLLVEVNTGLCEDLLRSCSTDPVNIRQANFRPFVFR